MTNFLGVRWALCLASFGIAGPASASDWWFVGGTGSATSEVAVFVDQASIRSTSDTKMAWSYFVFEKLDHDGWRKLKMLERFNCSNRTTATTYYIALGNNNTVLKSVSIDSYNQKAKDIAPDTISETALEFVCEGPKSDAVRITSGTPEDFAVKYFKL